MKKHYVTYDILTGRIKQYGYISDMNLLGRLQVGEGLLEGYGDPALKFVQNDVIVDRPTMGLSFDTETVSEGGTITITGIPMGTSVTVMGEPVVVNDGTLEITLPYSGSYWAFFQNFPYQDWEQEFVCV